MLMPMFSPVVAAVAPSLTGAYVASGADNTTFSFGAEPTGTERRFIVACIGFLGADSSFTVSIAGTNGTFVANTFDATAAGSTAAIVYREVSTGTSGNINAADFTGNNYIHVYRLITTAGADLAITDFATDASGGTSESLNINVLDGGFALGVGAGQNNSSNSWTGLTEDADLVISSSNNSTSASLAITADETPRTVTVTHSSTTNSCAASASFHFTPV